MGKLHLITGILLLQAILGCANPRWALRDRDYRDKYSQDTSDLRLQAKQAVDARHVREKWGYVGGGGASPGSPFAGHLKFGYFDYMESWLERQFTLGAFRSNSLNDTVFGPQATFRVQSPSRLAPFVGVSGLAGVLHKGTLHDGVDLIVRSLQNDDDDCGCDKNRGLPDDHLHPVFVGAPEVGVHYWLNADLRATASLSYAMSTEGRDHDAFFLNFEIARLNLKHSTAPISFAARPESSPRPPLMAPADAPAAELCLLPPIGPSNLGDTGEVAPPVPLEIFKPTPARTWNEDPSSNFDLYDDNLAGDSSRDKAFEEAARRARCQVRPR
ncbi:hypothetical protein [Lignipirellula cremea]|uniref:Lipoprotein n=1 Tax=Lignipirellula cremea TaxID=2528010 RepID=A0A518DWA3_9BACT|nr:hypothetical protein [Lignipirellula cremea]QDU96109.1 hypothetical protein Pla8534_39280 [Lignipirellula cremea]